jgi:bifunctional DNA-binding transcriptional regulator/antitoxin component of YhaV-PrlF toxin-antitoxin module
MQPSRADFDLLTQGFTSKSDKIRALARHGALTADIARYLDIRYQHARNVLVQSGLHNKLKGADDESRNSADTGAGRVPKSTWIEIDDLGRLQLPAGFMEAAGIRGGQQINVRVSDDGIEILSKRGALQRAQEIVGEFVPPGVSLVDELIAERRREANRDDSSEHDGGR